MRWQGGEQSENLEDRRRMGPKTVAGGGLGILVIVLIGYFLGADPKQLNQLLQNAQNAPAAQNKADAGPESPAEKRSREFAATILRFTEKVWGEQFQRAGKEYQPPHMVLFSRRVETGCGTAPSAVGPFYCPVDRTLYLDPTFFDELSQKLGGSDAEFSQAYVIAHEVGHHVQNLLGYSRIVDEKRQSLPEAEYNEWSVRLELQADYLSGVWAHYGQEEFQFLESGDVDSAIKTAQAIGDDRLQKNATGFTSPEKYTHGTSEQRVRWFRRGFDTGDMSMLKKIFETPYEQL